MSLSGEEVTVIVSLFRAKNTNTTFLMLGSTADQDHRTIIGMR